MKILGTGSALPEKVVTNDDLAQVMDTSDEWIRTRTGIQKSSRKRTKLLIRRIRNETRRSATYRVSID